MHKTVTQNKKHPIVPLNFHSTRFHSMKNAPVQKAAKLHHSNQDFFPLRCTSTCKSHTSLNKLISFRIKRQTNPFVRTPHQPLNCLARSERPLAGRQMAVSLRGRIFRLTNEKIWNITHVISAHFFAGAVHIHHGRFLIYAPVAAAYEKMNPLLLLGRHFMRAYSRAHTFLFRLLPS